MGENLLETPSNGSTGCTVIFFTFAPRLRVLTKKKKKKEIRVGERQRWMSLECSSDSFRHETRGKRVPLEQRWTTYCVIVLTAIDSRLLIEHRGNIEFALVPRFIRSLTLRNINARGDNLSRERIVRRVLSQRLSLSNVFINAVSGRFATGTPNFLSDEFFTDFLSLDELRNQLIGMEAEESCWYLKESLFLQTLSYSTMIRRVDWEARFNRNATPVVAFQL